jgi:hypothetical protein
MRTSFAGLGFALWCAACGTTLSEMAQRIAEYHELIRAGDPRGHEGLALAIARGDAPGSLGEMGAHLNQAGDRPLALALGARVAEAQGRLADGLAGWLRAAASEAAPARLRAWTLVRAWRLVDTAPIDPATLTSLGALARRADQIGLLAAEVLEQAALRAQARGPLEEARRRLGGVGRYEVLGRVHPLPVVGLAEARVPAPEAPALLAVETPDGSLGLPEEGPGVIAARVTVPQGPASEVEVWTGAALRAISGEAELARHEALRRVLPKRVRFRAPPGAAVTLLIASRDPAPELRVMARPVTQPDPPGDLPEPLEAWVALDLALHVGDAALAQRALRALGDATGALLLLDRATALAADPTRPASVTAREERQALEAALARDPTLAETRARLSLALLTAGDLASAHALARGGSLGAHQGAVDTALARERSEDAAQRDASVRWREAVPSSCGAAQAWLDAHWDEARARGPDLERMPWCFEVWARTLNLALEGWRLAEAGSVLRDLETRARPGRERARLELTRGRLALSRGDLQAALAASDQAYASGVMRLPALELRLAAETLAGNGASEGQALAILRALPEASPRGRRRALDPGRDLGLPLADGLSIAKEASRGDPSSGESVQVLLEDLHTQVFADGGMVHRVHRILRLLDDTAVEAQGEIPLPDEAEIILARSWVPKPTDPGEFEPVEPEDILDKASLSLAGLEPGSVVEAAWFWYEEPDPLWAPGWHTPSVFLDSELGPTRRAVYRVRVPDGALPVVDPRGSPEMRVSPDGTLWSFELRGAPRYSPEPLDPRPEDRRARVILTEGASYEHFRAVLRDRLLERIRSTPEIEATADRALQAAGADPDSRLRALVELVLDEVQSGDQATLERPASFTVASKSGERSTLLVALCAAEPSLRCDLALARPRHLGDPTGAPAPHELGEFHYPLVRVEVPGRPARWIDTSNPFMPVGYLPPPVQGVRALNLGDGPLWLTTPEPHDQDGTHRIQVELQVGADGAFRARGTEVLTGAYAMGWRFVLAKRLEEERRQGLETLIRRTFPGAEVERVSLEGLTGRETPLRISWEARGSLQRDGEGGFALALGLSPEGLGRDTVRVGERKTPLFVTQHAKVDMVVRAVLPAGARWREPPAPVDVEDPLLSFARRALVDGPTLVLTKHHELRMGEVQPARYAAWRVAATAVDRAEVLHLRVELPGAVPP